MSRENDFSPSSSWTVNHTGYRPGNGQFEWDHHAAFQNTRRTTPGTDYRPFEERFLLRPSGVTNSIPMDPPYSLPTRFIIVNNRLDHGPNHRIPSFLRQFRHRPVSQGTRYAPPTEITPEEQETVLTNLHRQTYNHVPKMARRVSLYYRDLNRDANVKNKDEDGKNCAVCLEDFEDGEEVMVTPCKHMFHEECIIPWVKNHSNCPVCRSALCKSAGENRSAVPPTTNDILSLIRAVDEAFVLGA
ncbi:uncharacterized protein LOC141616780 [Silene latifolia]|uniref:uncharacterized protein LOC141616780 n=1 Tax=Silene latifolia TaxID=37657 RepID=UPI003D77CF7B